LAERTVIRDADWVVGWDADLESHTYRRDCDVVFDGDRIDFVGTLEAVPDGARVIDGRGFMVMPGLVNVHAHPSTEPGFRGVREDHGAVGHYMSSLFERFQAFSLSNEGRAVGTELGYA
jgi:cytosine/adenosine deaminase-related metal-dependent hydrolase